MSETSKVKAAEVQAPVLPSLSPEQMAMMQYMMQNIIAEMRKPAPPTPEQEAQMRADKQMREERGKMELEIQANRRREQMRCTHLHPNGTACVAEIPNLAAIICVHCQAMIKAAPGPYDETGRYIYDENLYFRLLSQRSTTTY